MKDEDKQRQLQMAVAQMEAQRNRLEGLAGQMRLIETALAELGETKKALAELAKGKKDANILVPIGSGSYIKAKVEDPENILVGVGAGVSIEKKIPQAEEILKAREEEYTKTIAKLREVMENLSAQMGELNETAEALAAELGGRK